MQQQQKPVAINEYLIKERLGVGSFGCVYKALRLKDGKQYAIKQIDVAALGPGGRKAATNEVKLLARLEHENVVQYFDSFIWKSFLCIVMELCDADLSKFLKQRQASPLTEAQVLAFFYQAAKGLKYIHEQGVIHRDVKTLNLFVKGRTTVKVGDLGVAKFLAESSFAQTVVGTAYYLAPEICKEQPYNFKSDVWALGCVLYQMCAQKHPFEAKSTVALVTKITKGEYEPIPSRFSQPLHALVDKMLANDQQQRFSMAEVVQFLGKKAIRQRNAFRG